MATTESITIGTAPAVEFYGTGLHELGDAAITGFDFAGGSMVVDRAAAVDFTRGQLPIMLMAITCLNNAEISAITYRREDTTKTHLRRIFSKLDGLIVDGTEIVPRRTSLALAMSHLGMLKLTRSAPATNLTKAELPIVAMIAAGATNREIAGQIGRSPLTVKSHLARIAGRTTANSSREGIVLQGLMNGELAGRYPNTYAQLSATL